MFPARFLYSSMQSSTDILKRPSMMAIRLGDELDRWQQRNNMGAMYICVVIPL